MIRIDSASIARAHDAMAEEYDRIEDPWYTHLFSTMHETLLEAVERMGPEQPRRALDVGCGTGLQAHLLADAGFDVVAFDLSDGLLSLARAKQSHPSEWAGDSRFERDMRRFHARAVRLRGKAPRGEVRFLKGDAGDPASYAGGPFDLMVSFGSVLSFVEDPDSVLRSMRAACASGGRVLIECEMKANLDLAWPLADPLLGGRLGYDQSFRTSLGNLAKIAGGDVETVYPFELQDGSEVLLPMRLFSHRGLARRIGAAGFRIVRTRGVHAVTNLVPSTVLHQPVGARLSPVLSVLESLDRALGRSWPLRRFCCSSIFEMEA